MSRIDYYKVGAEGLQNVLGLEKYINKTGIDATLREYIKLRESQINGCAYCVKLHTQDLVKLNEPVEKISCLSVWKETDYFSDKEKTILELVEHVTLVSEKGVPDTLYQKVRNYYSDKEYIDLILIISQINTWNRISISMGNTASID